MSPASHLDLARKMARHSLTEARRSVMDLRASALEGHDLPAALSQAARQWTAGSEVQVHVDVARLEVAQERARCPKRPEQHLLRIAQEAVANTIKHAQASEVRIRLELENGRLRLSVADDGQGFEQTDAFSEIGGHFGLLGMRERAERSGRRVGASQHARPRHRSGSEGAAAVIRILIAEDHLIARVGVKTILNTQPDMNVVAEAANGAQAVELHRQHRPDITLMDMRMPGTSGLEAIAAIRAEQPQARIIALSTYGGDEDIRRALNAGVRAYLTKDVLHDELIRAIHAVHAGETYLPPSIRAALEASSLPAIPERA